jgi:hypothetical protein
MTGSDNSTRKDAIDKLIELFSRVFQPIAERHTLEKDFGVTPPLKGELLKDATAAKLEQLLKDDEAGWRQAARQIDTSALDGGIDLCAESIAPKYSLVQ